MQKFFAYAIAVLLSACSQRPLPAQSHSPPTSSKALAESRVKLGLAYLKKGQFLKARENLWKANEYDPTSLYVQLARAHYFELVGNLNQADSSYRAALAQKPNNGHVLNNYGTFLCKQNQYVLANQYLKSAIKQPGFLLIAAGYENAALCALKAGDKSSAKIDFSQALIHDPSRLTSLLNLARLDFEQNETLQAESLLVTYHQNYGFKRPTLQLLIEVERALAHPILVEKYTKLLMTMRDKRS